jgi:hypothetical protein
MTSIAIKQLIDKSHAYTGETKKRIMYKKFNSCHLSTEQKVKCAARYLLEHNECPTVKRISKITGIGCWKLRNNLPLYDIIVQQKVLFKKKRDADIRSAIITLRARKIPISITAISTYLGRSFWYIKKNHISILFIHALPNRKFHISPTRFFAKPGIISEVSVANFSIILTFLSKCSFLSLFCDEGESLARVMNINLIRARRAS